MRRPLNKVKYITEGQSKRNEIVTLSENSKRRKGTLGRNIHLFGKLAWYMQMISKMYNKCISIFYEYHVLT